MTSDLPEAALAGWNAFKAMEQSKRRYFSYLETLERKYEDGGMRLLAEEVRLDGLLKEHDHQVAEFGKAVKALGAADPVAQKALIAHMTAFNTSIGTDEPPTA